MKPHSWTMTGQDGERCEWVCSSHDPACRKTTYDGKGASTITPERRLVDAATQAARRAEANIRRTNEILARRVSRGGSVDE